MPQPRTTHYRELGTGLSDLDSGTFPASPWDDRSWVLPQPSSSGQDTEANATRSQALSRAWLCTQLQQAGKVPVPASQARKLGLRALGRASALPLVSTSGMNPGPSSCACQSPAWCFTVPWLQLGVRSQRSLPREQHCQDQEPVSGGAAPGSSLSTPARCLGHCCAPHSGDSEGLAAPVPDTWLPRATSLQSQVPSQPPWLSFS